MSKYKEVPVPAIYALSLDGVNVRYVGRTIHGVEKRLKSHIASAERHGSDFPVHRWIRKHGGENIILQVLEECAKEDIVELETVWILAMRDQGHALLNCSDGGEGMTNPTPEITAARVAANKKRFEDPAERARMGQLMLAGRNGSSWNKGVSWDEETKEKIRQSVTGFKHTDEAKAKLSAKSKGNQHALGYKHTPEALAKMSEATKKWSAARDKDEQSRIARKAMHVRWHTNRNLIKEGCEYCDE